MTSLSTLTSIGSSTAEGSTPAESDPFALLPRNVWRHLVTTAGLGLKSQVIVAGDGAGTAANFFRGLGCEATAADEPPSDSSAECDAVIWLEIRPIVERSRSLLARESLQQTAQLLRRVGSQGAFQFVCLIGNDGSAHEAECVERHLTALGEQPQVTVFRARSFAGFLLGAGRTYAVATCCRAHRHQTTHPPAFHVVDHHDDSCCRGADRSRAA